MTHKKKFLQKARLLVERKDSSERPCQSANERQNPSDNSQTFVKSIYSDGSITEHGWNYGHSIKGDVTGQDHTQKVNDDEETHVKNLISDVSFSLNDSQNDSQDKIKLVRQEFDLEKEGDCSESSKIFSSGVQSVADKKSTRILADDISFGTGIYPGSNHNHYSVIDPNPDGHSTSVKNQRCTQNSNYADASKSDHVRFLEGENMANAEELPYQCETSDNNAANEKDSLQSSSVEFCMVKEQNDSAFTQSVNNESHDLTESFSGGDISPKRDPLSPNILHNLKSVVERTVGINTSSDSDCMLYMADKEKYMEYHFICRNRQRTENENPVDVYSFVNRCGREIPSVNRLLNTAGIIYYFIYFQITSPIYLVKK